jgi:hypothetical protein
VRFINHQPSAMPFFYFDNFTQWRTIAQRAVKAFDDDQGAACIFS